MPLTRDEAARLLLATTAQQTYDANYEPRLALCTTEPTSTSPGTEVSGGSYTRQPVPSWHPPEDGSTTTTIANSGAVSFDNMPDTSVGWCNVYDADAPANRKWFGALAAVRDTQAGDVLTFADRALVLGLVTEPGNTQST